MAQRTPSHRIPVVLGPTASGKSTLAFRWAIQHGAEILSADSRQLYRDLDIGTAKPSDEEQQRVPHHFVDAWDVTENVTAPAFASAAEKGIADLQADGKRVVVVGGSTLYLHALVHGLSSIPEVPAEVRASVEQDLDRRGLGVLLEELQRYDPELAARIDRSNPRRVQRAIEVFRHTGRPLSSFQGARIPPAFAYRTLYLAPERGWLYQRIDARVDQMMASGLLEEVEALLSRGYASSLPPLQSIGYGELIRHLHGEMTLENAVEAIKTNTRRYAKRQMTYFNKYFPEAVRIDPARTALDGAAIDQMLMPT